MAYGNLHSLVGWGTLTDDGFRNIFRNQNQISDYSKLWLPLPSGYSVSGLYGSGWRQNNSVKKLPILRITDWSNLPGYTINALGYYSPYISILEICWTSWGSSDSYSAFLGNGAGQSVSPKYIIKPESLTNTNPIPSNGWTFLNRKASDHKLYYTNGTPYTGDDPYAWYYDR